MAPVTVGTRSRWDPGKILLFVHILKRPARLPSVYVRIWWQGERLGPVQLGTYLTATCASLSFLFCLTWIILLSFCLFSDTCQDDLRLQIPKRAVHSLTIILHYACAAHSLSTQIDRLTHSFLGS